MLVMADLDVLMSRSATGGGCWSAAWLLQAAGASSFNQKFGHYPGCRSATRPARPQCRPVFSPLLKADYDGREPEIRGAATGAPRLLRLVFR